MSDSSADAAADILKMTGDFGDDPISVVMKKYDKDGNGTFDISEVRSIVYDVQAQGQKIGMLRKMVGMLMVIIVATLIAMFGVSFAAGFALKDTAMGTSDGGGTPMVATDGSAVTVGVSEEARELFDLGSLDMATLAHMNTFSAFVDKTTDPKVNGWTSYAGKVAAVEKSLSNADKVTLTMTTGAAVTIDSATKTGSLVDNGNTYPVSEDDPTVNGRRLGRRGGGIRRGGSVTLSSGGNTAGNR